MSHAARQLNRIVTLVADCSREAAGRGDAPTLQELADRYGITTDQILGDIRRLVDLGDSADQDWLLSFQAYQEGDRLYIESRGPFRRPIRFTPDEVLALRVALATEAGPDLSPKLGAAIGGGGQGAQTIATADPAGTGTADPEDPIALIRHALGNRSCVDIGYAASDGSGLIRRTIHPHDLVLARGRYYVIAWCDLRNDWRRFRADRILEAAPGVTPYEHRPQHPRQLFVPPDGDVDRVTVRCTPSIARWIVERYPDAQVLEDGSVAVTYEVADSTWPVRHVLQYGAEAEVVRPRFYRTLVLDAVRRERGNGVTG